MTTLELIKKLWLEVTDHFGQPYTNIVSLLAIKLEKFFCEFEFDPTTKTFINRKIKH